MNSFILVYILITRRLQIVDAFSCKIDNNYVNDMDGPMDASGGSQFWMDGAYSYHNNHREDRQWKFRWCTVDDNQPFSSFRTDVQTSWDGQWSRVCYSNEAIYRAQSQHNNHREDRIWTFGCARFKANYYGSSCQWFSDVNEYDQVLDFSCLNRKGPSSYLRGIQSYHNNHREDRRFSFLCCNLNTVSAAHSIGTADNEDKLNNNNNNNDDGIILKFDSNTNFKSVYIFGFIVGVLLIINFVLCFIKRRNKNNQYNPVSVDTDTDV